MNVSPDFSLPLRIVAPYFIAGVAFYILSIILLLSMPFNPDIRDTSLIAFSHSYMIGFVMMVIIGAMAQLSVVVAEVYHKHPRAFIITFILLLLGTVIIIYGFLANSIYIPIGGMLILVSLFIYIYNLFISVSMSSRSSAVVDSMRFSTLFLAVGLIFGIVMALGYGGVVDIDPSAIAPLHIMSIFGGYVMLNIMGVSTVLLPMFGACSRPSDMAHKISFYMMIATVIMMIFSLFLPLLSKISAILASISIIYYMFVVFRIFTSKKRKYSDVWERFIAVSFISLLLFMIVLAIYIFSHLEILLKLSFYILMIGFLGFLIVAHLYKIVPFLVWFERFAPFIEEKAVPSLYELLPAKVATTQWYFATAALVLSSIALLLEIEILWYFALSLLLISSIFLAYGIYLILSKR